MKKLSHIAQDRQGGISGIAPLRRFRGWQDIALHLHLTNEFTLTSQEEAMELILIIVVLFLLFGGGGYWGYSRWR
jgi:hypothetical protein